MAVACERALRGGRRTVDRDGERHRLAGTEDAAARRHAERGADGHDERHLLATLVGERDGSCQGRGAEVDGRRVERQRPGSGGGLVVVGGTGRRGCVRGGGGRIGIGIGRGRLSGGKRRRRLRRRRPVVSGGTTAVRRHRDRGRGRVGGPGRRRDRRRRPPSSVVPSVGAASASEPSPVVSCSTVPAEPPTVGSVASSSPSVTAGRAVDGGDRIGRVAVGDHVRRHPAQEQHRDHRQADQHRQPSSPRAPPSGIRPGA